MLLEDGEVFILLVRVPSYPDRQRKIPWRSIGSQFAPVKRAVMITIKLVE